MIDVLVYMYIISSSDLYRTAVLGDFQGVHIYIDR